MMENSIERVARLTGPRPRLDPRRCIARVELVDIALADRVAAARYVAPVAMTCVVPRTPMRAAGNGEATAVSELLCGEGFQLFDSVDRWGFGCSLDDHYVGWVPLAALTARASALQTRYPVTARVAPVFASPSIKAPLVAELPLGAWIDGETQGDFTALSQGGYLHVRHTEPIGGGPLAVARRFLGAPYLWGGRTPLGVDCSGLIQAAFAMCAIAAPRDSDQQRDELGMAVDFADRQRGDLVFFPGHVGILADANTLLHANAHWMATVEEPLSDVIGRGAEVVAVRRVA